MGEEEGGPQIVDSGSPNGTAAPTPPTPTPYMSGGWNPKPPGSRTRREFEATEALSLRPIGLAGIEPRRRGTEETGNRGDEEPESSGLSFVVGSIR